MQTFVRLIIVTFFISSSNLKAQDNVLSESGESALYWTGTIAFSAINVTTTYFNIKKLHKYDKYRSNAIFGALSGAAQTALGFAFLNAEFKNASIPSGINIGIGLTTFVTSVIRLATKNPPKENDVTFNFIYLPSNKDHSSVVGLVFKKQF